MAHPVVNFLTFKMLNSNYFQDSDDEVAQNATGRANRVNENATVKNEVVSEADYSEAVSLASLKRKKRKKSRKKISNPDLSSVKVETNIFTDNQETGTVKPELTTTSE